MNTTPTPPAHASEPGEPIPPERAASYAAAARAAAKGTRA